MPRDRIGDWSLDLARGAGCARAGFFMIHRTRCITYTLLYYPLTYSSPHTLLCVPLGGWGAHTRESRLVTRHSGGRHAHTPPCANTRDATFFLYLFYLSLTRSPLRLQSNSEHPDAI